MTLRALIVDDEELARRGIRALLERAADVEVVGECATAGDAIEVFQRERPDLVFLDIQMPDKSGFDVIDAIGPDEHACVVFVTAHDDFAIRAFDVHAFDYLLKPLDQNRFEMTLSRVRKALLNARERSMGLRLARLAADLNRSTDDVGRLAPDRIPVKSDGRIVVIRIADVDCVRALKDYVSLVVGKKSWLTKETLGSIEERFAPAGFVRIHRSTLVNVNRVTELRPLDKGEYQVILGSGLELKLSRKYRAALPSLAGFSLLGQEGEKLQKENGL